MSPFAPVLIFGLTALLGGLLALILPETNNKILPNTIEVTNNIYSSQIKIIFPQEGEEFCSQTQFLCINKKGGSGSH